MTQQVEGPSYSQSSYEEVIAESLQKYAGADVTFNPAVKRIADLSIAGGNHLFMRPAEGLDGTLLVHDYDFGRTGSYRKVRESVVLIGSEIHHYLYDAKHAEFALFTGELLIDKATQAPVMDRISSPIIHNLRPDLMHLQVIAGEEYLESVRKRADHVELVSSEAAAEQYVKDTNRFMLPGTRRLQPTEITVNPCSGSWDDTIALLQSQAA